MNSNDKHAFAQVLQVVYDLYGKDLSEAVMAFWWAALTPYDFAAVRDALNRHAANPDNGQFIPKPADVVKLIGGGTMDAAMVAWSVVDKAVRSVGPYQSVVFDDPITMAVLSDMGGWIGLGKCTDEEWPFKAREFENRYRGYRVRGSVSNVPEKLIGIVDAENGPAGIEDSAPIRIGQKQSPARIESKRA